MLSPARGRIRPGPSRRLLLVAAWLLFAAAPTAAQETGGVSGRVLDVESLAPIPDVLVRIRSTELSALTGDDGRFRIGGIPIGAHVVLVEHLAYGEHIRAVVVVPGDDVRLQVRIASRPIEIAPIVVEARSELDQRRRSSGFAMAEILRAEIDDAARRGLNLGELLRQGMPGVRVRGGPHGPTSCVEFRGSAGAGPCREMAVYIDGVQISTPSTLYPSMPLDDIERLEAVSPGQAGARYGIMGGRGVLLIETRRGPRPERLRGREERFVSGFDWSGETGGYPWARVLGSSFVGNALGVGIGLLAANQCLHVDDNGLLGVRSRCNAVTTMAAGFVTLGLPSVAGSYAARWGGATNRSQGRILPAAVMGSMSAAAGYLLLVEGESGDAGGARNAGALMLGIGTPLLVAFSDRVFRVLR